MRNIIAEIREYENSASYARKTNERELPNLKFLVSDIEQFGFGKEDLDLKQRLIKVADKVQALEVVGITVEVLEACRLEVSDVRDTLVQRYRDRMEAYATRQGNI